VTYKIAVPEPLQDEIRSWDLSIDAEDELYARLERGLTKRKLDKCMRLAGPVPTFILYIDFQDPLILGISHSFTLYLEFGESPDLLYLVNAHHAETEDWGKDEADDSADA
jgi:hypothetical protein